MLQDRRRLTIPNPHGADISGPLTQRILDQAGITPEEWERVR